MKKIVYGLLVCCFASATGVAFGDYSQYGPTQENEHLYRIAVKIRPNYTVSLQQVMISLLKANPGAFKTENINGLKAGCVLRIPSLREIKQVAPDIALTSVQRQNHAWQERNSKPALAFDGHLQNVTSTNIPRLPISFMLPPHSPNQFNQPIAMSVNDLQVEVNPTYMISSFMQDTKSFEHQVAAQVNRLQKQNELMQAQIKKLTEELSKVNYQYVELTAYLKKNQWAPYLQALASNFKQYGLGLVASLLLLIMLILMYRKKSAAAKTKSPSPDRGQEEFFDGQENIPSKLDLARAYIDMGDADSAQSALRDVLSYGNDEQQQTARGLLDRLQLQS